METVNEIVLESALVILTGGKDIQGTPIVTLAADSADLLDIYSAGDILHLMQVYTDIAGGKIAVVADLKNGWTEDCVQKLSYILDELQASTRSSIKVVYLVRSHKHSKKGILERNVSLLRNTGRMIPPYEVRRLESVIELYKYIDRSELTEEYGGTLQYSHLACIDFHKAYSPLIQKTQSVWNTLKRRTTEASTMLCKTYTDLAQYNNRSVQQSRSKFQACIRKAQVGPLIGDCEEALEKLEHPEFDPSLMQVQTALRTKTAQRLQQVMAGLKQQTATAQEVYDNLETQHSTYVKLQECHSNCEEVLETIGLMQDQLDDLPHVGKTLLEAQTYRHHFLEHILAPSKDIIACATAILEDLKVGLDTTSSIYNLCFEIEDRLTDSVRPFTEVVNKLNETYIRIHLFYVVYYKTLRWKMHAVDLLNKHLLSKLASMDDTHTTTIQCNKQHSMQQHQALSTETGHINKGSSLKQTKTRVQTQPSVNETSNGKCQTLTWSRVQETRPQGKVTILETKSNVPFQTQNGYNLPETSRGLQELQPETKPRDQVQTCQRKGSQPNTPKGRDQAQFLHGQCATHENKSQLESNSKDQVECYVHRHQGEKTSQANSRRNSSHSTVHTKHRRVNLPDDWSETMAVFHKKHPPPKKKHLRLLTKFAPSCVEARMLTEAAILAERTLFIDTVQRKDHIKVDDLIAINSWSDNEHQTAIVSTV